MRRIVPVAVIIGTLLAAAAPAGAQVPGIDLKLIPKIGAFAPLSDLRDDGASLDPALALGLAIEFGVPVLPAFRINLDAATGATLKRDDGAGGELGDVRIMAITGDLVLRRRLLGLVGPYLLLGGGFKRYDFPATANAEGLADGSDLTGHLGLGLELATPLIGFVVEVSDYISRFDPGEDASARWQNDIFAMVGVKVGLF